MSRWQPETDIDRSRNEAAAETLSPDNTTSWYKNIETAE
jgi:hypothetical protein